MLTRCFGLSSSSQRGSIAPFQLRVLHPRASRAWALRAAQAAGGARSHAMRVNGQAHIWRDLPCLSIGGSRASQGAPAAGSFAHQMPEDRRGRLRCCS
eukprot:9005844-Pyramimonas_sp.AAC.1